MTAREAGQSPDEVFDVVDEHDVVVGRATRAEVHRRHLLHRAVHIFWLRPDGLLCLQRRSYAKDNCPGLLSSSCAGHVDAGEGYAEAAVRELGEELGVTVLVGRLREVDYAPWHPDLGHEFVRSYVLEGEFRPTLAQGEVDSVLWRSPAETLAWSQAEPEAFSSPLLHLLARPSVRGALGLP